MKDINQVKLDIVIAVPGMPFDGDTLKTKSLGGSETAGYYLALNLAKRGHNVKVFSNCEKPMVKDEVEYLPFYAYQEYVTANKHDINIVQRAPELLSGRVNSLVNILWCHDLALKISEAAFSGVAWNVDRVAVVSQFMADQYEAVYDIKDEDIFVTSNGVDLSLFDKLPPVKRDMNKLIYAARPERGLDVLLAKIFPKLLAKNPNFKLHLCGYDNPTESMAEFYKKIDTAIAQFGSSVVWLGNLTKEALYREYLTAGAYVYPTPSPAMSNFFEVSCITAMECQAAGLPFISSRRGALPETVPNGCGVLIDGSPEEDSYVESFVDSVLLVTGDADYHSSINRAAIRHSRSLDWGAVAEKWEEEFFKVIEQNNDDRIRLALHFLRNSDAIAAMEAIKNEKGPVAERIKNRISKEYGFIGSDSSYKDHYKNQSEIEMKKSFALLYDRGPAGHERIELLAHSVASVGKDLKVLDYGCAHGEVGTTLSNHLKGDWSYTGVDIDELVVSKARMFARKWATDSTKMAFMSSTEFTKDTTLGQYDVAILSEVLEHVEKPWELLDRAEARVKDGGRVFITVPSGPWEHEGYYDNKDREHVWEFDKRDLMEMLSDKKDLVIQYGLSSDSIMGTPLGHHYVHYTVNGKAAKPIDMERKLVIQRPRQTVSANIIAGPNSEDQLHWCMKALRPIADEIIIVDTGMSEEGLRIASQYATKIVKGSDPKKDGFETPRNEGLAYCSMDWILWIDTDEKLLGVENLHKYLRKNKFNGYSIHQHHFACDTQFNADMPVRLFRNNTGTRFYGMIHEHPEQGLNKGPGKAIVLSDVNIAHTGYLNENIRRQRFTRNYPLMQKDIETYPERILQKHFIMRDNMLMVTYQMEQGGGAINEDIVTRCRQTIDLYREHFLGKNIMFGNDAIQWYSQAVQVLTAIGAIRGVEVAFNVEAAIGGVQPSEPIKAWFASKEDAAIELNSRITAKVNPLMEEFYR